MRRTHALYRHDVQVVPEDLVADSMNPVAKLDARCSMLSQQRENRLNGTEGSV